MDNLTSFRFRGLCILPKFNIYSIRTLHKKKMFRSLCNTSKNVLKISLYTPKLVKINITKRACSSVSALQFDDNLVRYLHSLKRLWRFYYRNIENCSRFEVTWKEEEEEEEEAKGADGEEMLLLAYWMWNGSRRN